MFDSRNEFRYFKIIVMVFKLTRTYYDDILFIVHHIVQLTPWRSQGKIWREVRPLERSVAFLGTRYNSASYLMHF